MDHDAVEVPTPSADDVFIRPCDFKGKEMKDSVMAVLSWPPGSNPLKLRQPENQKVPAIAAWRIDEKARKFVKMSTGGLLCRT